MDESGILAEWEAIKRYYRKVDPVACEWDDWTAAEKEIWIKTFSERRYWIRPQINKQDKPR